MVKPANARVVKPVSAHAVKPANPRSVTFAIPSFTAPTLADVLAIGGELGLPLVCEDEQAFMQALRLALPRLLPVKFFRQVPGRRKVHRGGVMQGAPVGAADLTGYVIGPGRRIELEVKHGAGRLSPAQRQWIKVCASEGVLALVVAYDIQGDTATNLVVAASLLAGAMIAGGVR